MELGAKFCSHCGKQTPLGEPKSIDEITIVRKNKVSSFTIPFDVYIDYSLLGKNGTILSCPVSYGMHETVLKFTEKDAVQGIVLNENKKEVTLEVEQKMGLIAPKPNIKYK